MYWYWYQYWYWYESGVVPELVKHWRWDGDDEMILHSETVQSKSNGFLSECQYS
jgi:hypothetical protein